MKRRMSICLKLIVGLLVCAGALSLIAAGGQDRSGGAVTNSAANVNPPGVYPVCKTPITITVGVPVVAQLMDWETNGQTLMYEKKGNFDLQFEVFSGGAQEKLLIMVAGGSPLPEVLIGINLSEELTLSLGMDGVLTNLNPYYENWAYEIPRAIEKCDKKDLMNWLKSADGNIYYIPWYFETLTSVVPYRPWINTNWLEKLGLKSPVTTEEFRTVLEAFRDRDPNGNGRRDEQPGLSGGTMGNSLVTILMNSFVYYDCVDLLTVNNGRVEAIYTKPEYREGMRYINSLIRDGLINDDLYSITSNPLLRARIEEETYSTVGVFNAGLAQVTSPVNEMRLEYGPMSYLKGPQGVQWVKYSTLLPQKYFFMTKDAKNPEAIFRFGDMACGESESLWNRVGELDVNWRIPLPGEKSYFEEMGYEAKIYEISTYGAVQNYNYYGAGPGIIPMGWMEGFTTNDDPLNINIWMAASIKLILPNAAPDDIRVDKINLTLDEGLEIADLKLAINSYVAENTALFVTGQKNFERDWDPYIRELERIGLRRYLEITQSGYDRFMGRK